MTTSEKSSREWVAHNYCVAFIDLLGQRDALRGEGLLKPMGSEEERKAFRVIFRDSIGAIIELQELTDDLLRPILTPNPESPFRTALPFEQRAIWDEMQHTRITTQRWSDGIVSFVCLGDEVVKCKMNGVFGVLGLAGTLCLAGLATGRPVRGAIEIAWGVELQPGELYGPAVACAYELENAVAQYPRIVVGPETMRYLKRHANNPDQSVFASVDREFAALCLSMLARDEDGHWIVHYLG
ncbi:hypothetical protein, partial [Immundisolibacter sp.]|uniref:hypothetical protein n=1 Tax=Immundisolibacter sp. TaxID=1934948 RepID=UPI003F83CA84